jgi:SAM-dependent methyltransferase
MKILRYVLRILTLGRSPQSFIGALWIHRLLKAFPTSKRKWLALRILALSPHYFYRSANEAYLHMPLGAFLEAEYARNRETRQKIYDIILKRFLTPADLVLDYGCGPGFLARIVSTNVAKVYAMDIASGVLECAKILNRSDNLEYLLVDQARCVPSSSLDAIYSFAVIQHITDDAFERALNMCSEKLRPGGIIVFQVQLSDKECRTEQKWKRNASIKEKLRYRYGLHFFSRSSDYFLEVVLKFNLRALSLTPIAELCDTPFDDICVQHLLIAESIKSESGEPV